MGVMCICDSKKTKPVPESMRGRTGGSLLPLLFSFLSLSRLFPPSPPVFLDLLSPSFSPTFLPPLSILPPLSPFSHPLSPFTLCSCLCEKTLPLWITYYIMLKVKGYIFSQRQVSVAQTTEKWTHKFKSSLIKPIIIRAQRGYVYHETHASPHTHTHTHTHTHLLPLHKLTRQKTFGLVDI